MQNKELQDALVSLVIGAIVTWAIPEFVLGPLLASLGYSVDWWMYVIIFIMAAGTTIEALRKTRMEEKIAYDKGVTVHSPSDAHRFCTRCGRPVEQNDAFCRGCGAELNQ